MIFTKGWQTTGKETISTHLELCKVYLRGSADFSTGNEGYLCWFKMDQ